MRDILFRGKTVSGRWAEGSLIRAGSYCCILEDEDKVHPSDYPYLDNGLGYIDGRATPVDPETIGQFTGLLDKNGKKIFEGDMFVYAGMITYTVYWSENKLGFYAVDSNSNHMDRESDYLGNFYSDKCKVIGNIHDNPVTTFTY